MSTINHRHTYYGGSTTGLVSELSPPQIKPKAKRKYPSFGPYIVGATLGEGEFGKVKLGWSKNNSSSLDGSKQVAIKLIRRDTISEDSEKEIKIYREINALKQLTHPNIVKLEEVLQNSKYIGIVLEYASGGEFYRYIQRKRRLKEPTSCRLFAQLISGVSYIHSKGLVHRDLKLENLLLDKHDNLIITDFGFVNEYYSHNELMKTSCGSPCYAAPELVISTKPYEARKADIWSCGIILFAMLAGYLPWDDDSENPDGDDIARLYHYITRTPLKFPDHITAVPRDLLRHILIFDPKKRANMRYILHHQWLQPHLAFLSISPEEWDKISHNKNILRLPKHNKQYSSRPLSTCSTSSAGSKGDKRDSLIMDSTLLSFPAPPRESQSHVITIPSSPSPEMRRSPLRTSALHGRSNSAASIALQAVVDAEKEYYQHNDKINTPSYSSISYSSDSSIKKSNDTPLTTRHSGSINTERRGSFNSTRSPNFGHHAQSNTLMMNRENVIIETSPIKTNTRTRKNTFNSDIATDISFSNQKIGALNSNYHHSNYNTHHRKPRPTSYHPGLFSNVVQYDSPYTSANVPVSTIDETCNSSFIYPSGIVVDTTSSSNTSDIYPKVLTSPPSSIDSTQLITVQNNKVICKEDKLIVERTRKPELSLNTTLRSYSSEQPDSVKIHTDISTEVNTRAQNGLLDANLPSTPNKDTLNISHNSINNNSNNKNSIDSTTITNATVQGSNEPVSTEKKNNRKRFSLFSFYSSNSEDSNSIIINNAKLPHSRSTSISSSQNVGSRKMSITSTSSQRDSRKHSVSSTSNHLNPLMELDCNVPVTPVGKRIPSTRRETGKGVRSSIMVSTLHEDDGELKKLKHLEQQEAQKQPLSAATATPSTAKKVIDFFKRRSMRI